MPGVRVVRGALAGGERLTLPVPGRLYDSWHSSYNRSISHVELATSAAQIQTVRVFFHVPTNLVRWLICRSPPHPLSPTAQGPAPPSGAVSTSAAAAHPRSVAAILPRSRSRHHGSREERAPCGEEESGWDGVWWAAFTGFGRSSFPSSQSVTPVR
ncbi:hypothetical protein GW17_00059933 [Ensete ventricosum]|nr:hypothetical protein GW17_00059933 [Ensete ventricosum]